MGVPPVMHSASPLPGEANPGSLPDRWKTTDTCDGAHEHEETSENRPDPVAGQRESLGSPVSRRRMEWTGLRLGQVPVGDVPVRRGVAVLVADVFLAQAVGDGVEERAEHDRDADNLTDHQVVDRDQDPRGVFQRRGYEQLFVKGVELRTVPALDIRGGPLVRLLRDVLAILAGVPLVDERDWHRAGGPDEIVAMSQ